MGRLSLRWKVFVDLTLVVLFTAVLVGGVGSEAVRGLSALATGQARAALEQELRQRLLGTVQERARTDDALFEGVRAQAVALSRYIQWYYENPENLPQPGYLRGGSTLDRTSQGHWVNRADTPVGVFVSMRASLTEAFWREVGMLSFADPLLVSIRESTPGAARAWVISETRIVRIYPNVQLGHTGSPVGPTYDLTGDEPFQAAAPARNPERAPVWTAPYIDPVTGKLMITAAAPIYNKGGSFRGVAGVDMFLDTVLEGASEALSDRGGYMIRLDSEGRLISAPAEARRDLGLPMETVGTRGRAVVQPLADATVPGARALEQQIRGATAPGLVTFTAAGGRRYASFAPLPSTGWVLGLVSPPEQLEEASALVAQEISRLERLYLLGGGIGLLLVVGLAAWFSAWAASAVTRPVAQLVEGTRKLAGDLTHRLPPLGQDELGHLAASFNTMAESIERSRAEAVRQARALAEERNRLAREIHDTVAQGLTGVVVHLETLEADLSEAGGESLRHLRRARDLARHSLSEVRRSVWNLRPSAVAESGLAHAVRTLAADVQQDGIECWVEVKGDLALPEAVEDALFGVCQEALANVRRHSGARHARVSLAADSSEAELRVWDDGGGFDPERLAGPQPTGGFGLWAMQTRMRGVGGRLTVESSPGAGTTVEARVPLTGGITGGASDQTAGG